MAILTADKSLRSGYTTGACAAAGVKAALLYEAGQPWQEVSLIALDGTALSIPVRAVERSQDGAVTAEVVKFSGDDPDITDGVSVFTTIRHQEGEITFHAGRGIGTVTKPGLSLPVGEPAINPGPRELIRNVVRELTGEAAGVAVKISIPAGEELARQTLNPILGIEGGLSVIGTTGVLRPMSEEAFKESLVPQIDVAQAAGFGTQVFVPGKIGERIALAWGLPQGALVQTSNFIGFMLEAAVKRDVKRIMLFGHIGKLVKVAAGVFYTHNRIADARLETMSAYAAAAGMSTQGVQQLLASNTTEDALAVLTAYNLRQTVCQRLAQQASMRAERYLFQKVQVGTVLVSLTGELLGMDDMAAQMGRAWGWEVQDET